MASPDWKKSEKVPGRIVKKDLDRERTRRKGKTTRAKICASGRDRPVQCRRQIALLLIGKRCRGILFTDNDKRGVLVSYCLSRVEGFPMWIWGPVETPGLAPRNAMKGMPFLRRCSISALPSTLSG